MLTRYIISIPTKAIILFLILTPLMTSAQVAKKTIARLPDTGQIKDFTTTFGEDSDYLINAPSYKLNGDGTVTDLVTGLMWQQIDGGEMTYEAAQTYIANLDLGGYSDWRLPTPLEAYSIMIHQNPNPALDNSVFTKSGAEYWWTSIEQVNDTKKVWVTNAGGGIGNHLKTETISAGGTKKYHARAVRDVNNVVVIESRFTDNGDNTITDNLTNLMWQKIPKTDAVSWEDALNYAENLIIAEHSDWRLPNIKELQSLSDESTFAPSVTSPYFQNLGVKKYWSSTSLPNQTTKAWYWDTNFGITTYDSKSLVNHVIGVRSIKETTGSHTSFKELNKIVLSPIPANGILSIKAPYFESMEIRIFGMSGKEKFYTMVTGNELSIPTTDWSQGIYIVEVSNGQRKYSKIISIVH